MQLKFLDDRPSAELIIVYQGEEIKVDHVLDDTGSASTIFSSDLVGQTGITPQPDDPLHTIRRVGGFEAVFSALWIVFV